VQRRKETGRRKGEVIHLSSPIPGEGSYRWGRETNRMGLDVRRTREKLISWNTSGTKTRTQRGGEDTSEEQGGRERPSILVETAQHGLNRGGSMRMELDDEGGKGKGKKRYGESQGEEKRKMESKKSLNKFAQK